MHLLMLFVYEGLKRTNSLVHTIVFSKIISHFILKRYFSQSHSHLNKAYASRQSVCWHSTFLSTICGWLLCCRGSWTLVLIFQFIRVEFLRAKVCSPLSASAHLLPCALLAVDPGFLLGWLYL